ncbi:MAG: chemotaxis protein CheC [Halarchaeum sp.]
MRVDIDSLSLFNRLAGEGSRHAAGALSQLSGTDIEVTVTGISLLSEADLRETFEGSEHVGVRIGLGGGLEGETLLAFDRQTMRSLLSMLLSTEPSRPFDEMDRSGVKEIGNIAVGGFVDGWADHLGVGIDLTPPTYVAAAGDGILPDDFGSKVVVGEDETESAVFLFESTLRSDADELSFSILMLPEHRTLEPLLAEQTDDGSAVSLDQLSAFDRIARQGAASAADHLTAMTGVRTDLEVSKLRFVPVEDVTRYVGDERVVGTVFGLNGGDDGYLAILFDAESAERVADAMIPMEREAGVGEMEASAIKELGNVMTSGFIDGWANVLGTSIAHTPPEFVDDLGAAALDPLVNSIAVEQDHAFVVDTAIETPEKQFTCNILALPDGQRLASQLHRMDAPEADASE